MLVEMKLEKDKYSYYGGSYRTTEFEASWPAGWFVYSNVIVMDLIYTGMCMSATCIDTK